MEELVDDLVQKTLEPLKMALKDAKIDIESKRGGTGWWYDRMPKVKS